MDTEKPATNTEGKGAGFFGSQQLARITTVEFWSTELPAKLDPWTVQLADSFADDAWMAPWRSVAAVGPLAALGIGFLAPWLWPGMNNIYSESLVFLMLASAGAIVNWSLGAGLLLGYVVGDVLHVMSRTVFSSGRTLAGHVVGYLLLGILVVRVPQLARRLATGIRWQPSDATLRLSVRAALYGMACGGLALLWCQGTIVLIRPVFTWAGGQPTDEAVVPVQVHWPWIVALSALAAIVRVILEDFSVTRSTQTSLVAKLREQRRTSAVQHGAAWRGLAVKTRVALGAIFLTIILAGTYADWMDPIIVLIVTAVIGAWRNGLLGKVPQGWISLTARIPAALRMIMIPVCGFLISDMIVSSFWSTGSLRPVMMGALATVVLFYAMFPNTSPTKAARPPQTTAQVSSLSS